MSFLNNLKKKDEYYYDFGTGNKIKIEDSNKKDDFLIGFNSVTDTPIAKTLRFEPKEEVKPKPLSYSSNASYRAPQLNNTQSYTPSTAHLGGDIKTDEDKNLFYNAFKAENSVQQNKPQKSQNPDAIEFGEDSETYKILQDLGNRWYQTDSQQEKDRLHGDAETVRARARRGDIMEDRTDEANETMKRNANIGIAARIAPFLEPTGLSFLGVPPGSPEDIAYRSLLAPSGFLIGMVTDEDNWDYKYNPDWQVGGKDGESLETYDGKNLNADNNRNWLPWMYYDGHLMGADKFGNMNMAYVGKKMGLPEWVYQNRITTDGEDAEWVQRGIDLAKSGR